MAVEHSHLAHSGNRLQRRQAYIVLPLDLQLTRYQDVHFIAVRAAGANNLARRARLCVTETEDTLDLGRRKTFENGYLLERLQQRFILLHSSSDTCI